MGIFLLSMASAMTVYADFTTGGQTATTNANQPVSFNADFFSMNPPMNMKVGIYDSQDNLVGNTFLLNINSNGRIYYDTINTNAPSTAGTYEIRVIGTDKINTDSEFLTLIVNSTNNSPVITILGSNPTTVIQGFSYNEAGATATDVEDGSLTSSIMTSGIVNVNVVGTYTITYSVTDSDSNTATATRTVEVVSQSPGNTAPVIEPIPDQSITEGNNYVYQVEASDSDGSISTYGLAQAPGWLAINMNTGVIYGVAPLVSSTTEDIIKVEVTDNEGAVSEDIYTLKVKNFVSGSSSGGRVISDHDIYYQNRYFDQFNPDKVNYTANTSKNYSWVWVLLYILIALISIGILIVVFLLGKNLKR